MALPQQANLIRHWHVNAGVYSDNGVTPANQGDDVIEWHDVVTGDILSGNRVPGSGNRRLDPKGIYFSSFARMVAFPSPYLGYGERTIVVLWQSSSTDKGTLFSLDDTPDYDTLTVEVFPQMGYRVYRRITWRFLSYRHYSTASPVNVPIIAAFSTESPASLSNVQIVENSVAAPMDTSYSGDIDPGGQNYLTLGQTVTFMGAGFTGHIKAFAIWDKKLTSSEIAGITADDLIPTNVTLTANISSQASSTATAKFQAGRFYEGYAKSSTSSAGQAIGKFIPASSGICKASVPFSSYPFHEKKFDQLLNGAQSQNLLYLKARVCPCRDRSTGSPFKGCQRCHGQGYTFKQPEKIVHIEHFYYQDCKPPRIAYSFIKTSDLVKVQSDTGTVFFDAYIKDGYVQFPSKAPNQGQRFTVTYKAPISIRALVTGVKQRRETRQDMGKVEHGDFNLTLPYTITLPNGSTAANPAFYCTEPDRFVLLDSRIARQDILYKGELDRLLYGWIYQVEECYSIAADGVETDYTLGEDYRLEGNRITWLNDKLADNRPYTISYLAAPEYYIHEEQPQLRHQGHKPLPRKMLVRLWTNHPKQEVATYV